MTIPEYEREKRGFRRPSEQRTERMTMRRKIGSFSRTRRVACSTSMALGLNKLTAACAARQE
jgi:hypothetical protein